MTAHIEGACARMFARHETFHPRYGWLKKGVEAVGRDNGAFTAIDATVQLGVGKNMVRSIRYWASAAKLLSPAIDSSARKVREVATFNGEAIFGERGADPYLEAPGTLWLVHWWLLLPTCEIPVWWVVFQKFTAVEFTEKELVDFVESEIARSSWKSPNRSSIEKDISCLLRTYTAIKQGRAALDDLFDCPFRNLGIIEEDSPNRFRFVLGIKRGLPPEIVLFAVIEWMTMQESGAQTASISRLVGEVGGPGRAFRLGEAALTHLLEEAIRDTGIGSLSSGAGTRQLAIEQNLNEAKAVVLRSYYSRIHMRLALPLDEYVRGETLS